MRLLGTFLAGPFVEAARRDDAAALLNASRNIGLSATDSARALKVAGISLIVFFHQPGTRPQRIGTSSRCPSLSSRITSTMSVGAML